MLVDSAALGPPPSVIDVEASGFGRGSYPIEVGVALPSGRSHCFLVRPEPDWTHWDTRAAALHGISRDNLLARGQPVRDVAHALNELLAGSVVYTDAWGVDSSWVALLYERAGCLQRFRLETIVSLLDEAQKAGWTLLKDAVRSEMQLDRHRASADALVLQQALLRVGASDRGAAGQRSQP
jgi:hypothetical protein